MGVGLLGDNLPLNLPQQRLCFGQCHTQVGDVTKIIRPADLHHVEIAVTMNIGPLVLTNIGSPSGV